MSACTTPLIPSTRPGQWLGNGADELGLAGTVDRAPFQLLIDGQHPQRATQLGRGIRAEVGARL